MQFAARLAVFEQCVRDRDLFVLMLETILGSLQDIINLPVKQHRRTLRTFGLAQFLKRDIVKSFFEFMGFTLVDGKLLYPEERDVKLLIRPARAIERKLYILGPIHRMTDSLYTNKQDKRLRPVTVMALGNEWLKKLSFFFNKMLSYETRRAQEAAKKVLPTAYLQYRAIQRIRIQQKNIKNGTESGPEMTYERAQLIELMDWFRYTFFAWVDRPVCEKCKVSPDPIGTETRLTQTEECRVEVYRCPNCKGQVRFPRYNDPVRLLTSRCGRCGEWSNCFTLLCRTLGYDTRLVMDNQDHIWCEVYDFNERRWVHVDPCENKIDAPLLYEQGWNKILTHIFAFSRDDLQDVTWRYTTNHKEVLKRRRKLYNEPDLLSVILTLREDRQKALSARRKKFVEERCIAELLELMVEKKPGNPELEGRLSGSASWKRRRGEFGNGKSNTFILSEPGLYSIKYYTNQDQYEVMRDKRKVDVINGWDRGIFDMKDIFRKEEKDWKMVYLCREEDAVTGSITWKFAANLGFTMTKLAIGVTTKSIESGMVKWTVSFDEGKPKNVNLEATLTAFPYQFKKLTLKAELSGGSGDVFWQQAQLFRQPTSGKSAGLEIYTTLVDDEKMQNNKQVNK